MKSIFLSILDCMITDRELCELILLKNTAVRNQQFDEAAKLLERQREVENRMPTSDYLKELRVKLINANQTDNDG